MSAAGLARQQPWQTLAAAEHVCSIKMFSAFLEPVAPQLSSGKAKGNQTLTQEQTHSWDVLERAPVCGQTC